MTGRSILNDSTDARGERHMLDTPSVHKSLPTLRSNLQELLQRGKEKKRGREEAEEKKRRGERKRERWVYLVWLVFSTSLVLWLLQPELHVVAEEGH